MRRIPVLIFFLLLTKAVSQVPTAEKLDASMSVGEVGLDGLVWTDPRESPVELLGFEWIGQDQVYRRLPLRPKWEIREAVSQLADHSAGGQMKFRTDSKRIVLRVALAEPSGMYHMPATGQSGFDLYVDTDNEPRYVKTVRFAARDSTYQAELLDSDVGTMRNYTINFPLYNQVKSVMVGVDKGAILKEPKPMAFPGKIVIYGTSITQGGCVSRPGIAYTNVLSRKLDAPVVNLGFSGNGRGEPELAHLINQIEDLRLIVLDYEANANKTIQGTIGTFVDILRTEHPTTPILIMSKTRYAAATDGSEMYKLLMSNRDFQSELVKNRKLKGDQNIYFLDGSEVLGDDYFECTVDGSHPSDLGSYRIAEALLSKIKDILKI